jgi:hypothetical protein
MSTQCKAFFQILASLGSSKNKLSPCEKAKTALGAPKFGVPRKTILKTGMWDAKKPAWSLHPADR